MRVCLRDGRRGTMESSGMGKREGEENLKADGD